MPRLNKRRRQALKRKRDANAQAMQVNLASELGDTPRETGLRTGTSQLNKAAQKGALGGSDWRDLSHVPHTRPDWQRNFKRFGSK